MTVLVPSQFDIQRFEDTSRQNGVRYWYAHEFARELGYEAWPAFQQVINRAMASCGRLNIDITEVFLQDTVEIDGKSQKTFRLSRFACFLVAMHADSRKPEVAQAKVALAAIAAQLVSERIGETDLGRIETREDLKVAENAMTKAASEGGLESSQFGIFKDAGFRGMYNMSLHDLKARKGLETGKTLYDFMGLEELAGNLFRVTQTAARIRSKRVTGVRRLTDTAGAVGHEVRKMMIDNSGVAPEALPLEEDVSALKKRMRSAQRKMEKMDSTAPRGKRLSRPDRE